MRNSKEIFKWVERYHRNLHAQLRESKRNWQQTGEDHKPEEQRHWAAMNYATGATMIALRDVGRFILGKRIDDDRNPFDGPDDY